MKTKNIIAAVTALTILGGAMPYSGLMLPANCVTAEAADSAVFEQDGITYNIYDDHAAVVKSDTITGEIVIPAEADGKPVTVIGDSVFRRDINYGPELEITLPDSIEEIGDSAFRECTLVNFRMPAELRIIGDHAFMNSKVGDVVFPDKLESIGENAFYYASLGTELTLPSSLVSIGDRAFEGVLTLTSVTVPGSVRNMGYGIFKNAAMIGRAVFEEGVEYIPDYMFDMENVDYMMLPLDTQNYETASFGLTEVVLPDSLKKIGGSAFKSAPFTEIDIPDSVCSIGCSAFEKCYNLERVTIPEGVEEISAFTFCNCYKLAEAELPSSLKKIGSCAFQVCWALEDISLPDGLTEIGEMGLARTAVKTIVVPASVVSIGEEAFFGCESLTDITFCNLGCLIPAEKGTITDEIGGENPFAGTIHGYADSTAQEYAELFGRSFAPIDSSAALHAAPGTAAPAKSGGSSAVYGDANADRLINVADSVTVLQYTTNKEKYSLTEEQIRSADVDGISGLTGSDAIIIQKVDAGLLSAADLPLSK